MRSSNWPRNIAPATMPPMLSDTMRTLRRFAGTLPSTTRARDALDDGRLADARLADQHRIVLLAATQHRQHAANLAVAPGGGIELALARLSGQVAPELVEGRGLALLIWRALRRRGLPTAEAHRLRCHSPRLERHQASR